MSLAAPSLTEELEQVLPLLLNSAECRQAGRLAEALALLNDVLTQCPRFFPARLERARLLGDLGRYAEAIGDLDALLLVSPHAPDASALRESFLARALDEVDRALAQTPGDSVLLRRRMFLHWQGRDCPGALADCDALLGLNPGDGDARTNRGRILVALGRPAEAMVAFAAVVEAMPGLPDAWFNLGTIHQQMGHLAEARAAYVRAIELAPDLAEAHMEMAHCYLMEGDYAAAWPWFEWRWQTRQLKTADRFGEAFRWPELPRASLSRPRPAAAMADIREQTLLVWAEQGVGDTLQFARFVPQVAALAGKVVFQVPTALVDLLRPLDARVRVVGKDEPCPEYDVHLPLMSLPYALGLGTPEAMASPPYVSADPGLAGAWHDQLGRRRGLRIGLAWAGRQSGTVGKGKDVPVADLAPLLDTAAEFVILQKEQPAGARAWLQGRPRVSNCGPLLRDFADTAALIANVDWVISVDTAVAHLACAMGKPCWLLLRHEGEWRWGGAGKSSPWYPSARLFRQPAPGDWPGAVAELTMALQEALS